MNDSEGSAFKALRKSPSLDGVINRIAWSPVKNELAFTSFDHSVQVWDLTAKGTRPRVLQGHRDWVSCVTWSRDGRMLASSSGDSTVRLWEAASRQPMGMLIGHSRTVFGLDWSSSRNLIATASGDGSVGIWNPESRDLIGLLRGHSNAVYSVAWAPKGRNVASGSEDHTIRIWDAASGQVKRILEGHHGAIYALAWSPDGTMLASASEDYTVRIWGRRSAVLEGHTGVITDVSFSADGRFLASKALDGKVRIWRCDTWENVEIIPEPSARYWTAGLAFHPKSNFLATLDEEDRSVRVWRFDPAQLDSASSLQQTVRYTNAKVVLLGDSGVGKSTLAHVLRGKPYQDLTHVDSTHARQVLPFHREEFVTSEGVSETREILLWDMAGQPTYRLIHQLHLNEVALALMVFNVVSNNDPFSSVRYWDRALRQAQRLHARQLVNGDNAPLKTFLVAARMDRGGLGVSRAYIEDVRRKLKFQNYFETSAREDYNIQELAAAIRASIDWDALPKVSSTRLFQRIKTFLNDMREAGRLLHTVDQLYDTFLLTYEPSPDEDDLRGQFETCIGLVESQGFIKRFSFGGWVLLQPELLDAYASAMITAARDESDLGMITEQDALNVRFRMSQDARIEDREQEEKLLIATVEDLLLHEIAIRDDEGDGSVNLIFPSQSARPYPRPVPRPDAQTAIWHFDGAILNIYAMLLVRLWNTRSFKHKELYENAAVYTTEDGAHFRIFLEQKKSGVAELMLFSDPNASSVFRTSIEEYIHAQLRRHNEQGRVIRTRVVTCPSCGEMLDNEMIRKRQKRGLKTLRCGYCDHEFLMTDAEEAPQSPTSLIRQAMVDRYDREAETQLRKQRDAVVMQGKRLSGEYDVFISYNHDNRDEVLKIAAQLTERGILPWIDEWELVGGENYNRAIERQLQTIKVIAFFHGSEGYGDYQMGELEYAKDEGARVVPVILSNTPNPVRLPPLARGKTWVDFRKDDPVPLDELVRAILDDQSPVDLQ